MFLGLGFGYVPASHQLPWRNSEIWQTFRKTFLSVIIIISTRISQLQFKVIKWPKSMLSINSSKILQLLLCYYS